MSQFITKFISVQDYARANNIDRKKIYRLIKEHVLKQGEDWVYADKVVKTIQVREDLEIK